MERQEIIDSLVVNHKLDNEWIRCILIALVHPKSTILLHILSCGSRCTISNEEFCKMYKFDKKTFTNARSELIEMNLISFIPGNSSKKSSEYFKNIEKIADMIIDGSIVYNCIHKDIAFEDCRKTRVKNPHSQKRENSGKFCKKSMTRVVLPPSNQVVSTVFDSGGFPASKGIKKKGYILKERKIRDCRFMLNEKANGPSNGPMANEEEKKELY